ncbi:MAG: hypothetical protein FD169_1839 [Bacillota bacterium]|nr:MAG: hypothetical protein FD169_1839 [Bacillota bacterium]
MEEALDTIVPLDAKTRMYMANTSWLILEFLN